MEAPPQIEETVAEMNLSGKSYKVVLHGRAGISYEENGLVFHIDSEILDSHKFEMVVFLENDGNWKTEGSVMPDAEKVEIIKTRVRHKLRKIRIEWE